MKKIIYSLILVSLSIFYSSCSKEETVLNSQINYPIFEACFADGQTKTYVDNHLSLLWHSGDQISIFHNSTLNEQYVYTGQTGMASGEFYRLGPSYSGSNSPLSTNYGVYPYNSSTTMNVNGEILIYLPSEQSYTEGSFGRGANTMVAVTKGINDLFLPFKNVCGYLRLKLYGDNVSIKSIAFKGNNNEKIAGKGSVIASYSTVPNVVISNEGTQKITLDCGPGVRLGNTSSNATEFWIVIPPITFSDGFQITVTDTEGRKMQKSVSREFTIQRNIINNMATFRFNGVGSIITYTTSNGKILDIWPSDFDAEIVSHTYKNGQGTIVFNTGLTEIGSMAFSGFSNLTSITIPEGITKIEYSAFLYCSALTSITLPEGLTEIGQTAFFGCTALANVTLPDGLKIIGPYAFENCTALTNINIPHSVDTFGAIINIPEQDILETYGTNPFVGCTNLTSFTGKYASSDGRCIIQNGKLISFARKNLTSYTIPNGVTQIGEYVFEGCTGLTNIQMPESLESFGINPFAGCTNLSTFTGKYASLDGRCIIQYGRLISFARKNLTSYTIPDGVTHIGERAFEYCNLSTIFFPQGLTHIGERAFYRCSSLIAVTLPESVKKIEVRAFYECLKLKKVFCEATTPPILESEAFFCNAQDRKFYVDKTLLYIYKNASTWSIYAADIEGFTQS